MLTVAVQAGGQSSRMGTDKGLVPLAGRPLIEHVLARVRNLGQETVVTTNDPDRYAYLPVRLVSDEEPGAGALAGLQTALRAARGERVLVVACDMPFLQRPLLEHVIARSREADVAVPRWANRFQTMHAVYRRARCLAAVNRALAEGQMRMISFYPHVEVRALPEAEVARFDPTGRSFFNVNTPEDLARAEAMLTEGA